MFQVEKEIVFLCFEWIDNIGYFDLYYVALSFTARTRFIDTFITAISAFFFFCSSSVAFECDSPPYFNIPDLSFRLVRIDLIYINSLITSASFISSYLLNNSSSLYILAIQLQLSLITISLS